MTADQLPALDRDGHLVDYQCWTPDIAVLMAAHDGLALTPAHLTVLVSVRTFYERFAHVPTTRPLIRYLMQQVDANLSNAQLMADFQTGLVARTLARLAGLPKPPNCL
ncbi:MAG: TusE/DsrC/DsvC family sulfur relay protein [Pseudomonadota bacterium]|jgi:tRNA 2-thiouridine synthesizing protein E